MTEPRFHDMPDGRRIAYRFAPGNGPALVFLPGYMSDMAGGKAEAVFAWARQAGRACLLLDYSGCGLSDGNFAQGTLSRWCEEALALIEAQVDGPVILIGSSMGGWLMLLAALRLPADRLAGLVGIAAAPDFTEWAYDEARKSALAAGETVFEDNPYGSAPTPTHPAFWADGQTLCLTESAIMLDCPVRLLHGQADSDVPWQLSLTLAERLHSSDVQIVLVKDGDHRLSRDRDIALLLRTLAAFPA